MMDQKRIPCTVQQSAQSSLMPKRQKGDISISSKDSKERLGEKIIALQQLVSPYGKTDTASVLSEASQYIQFLHEQVKVLSAPYLQSGPAADQLQPEKQRAMPRPSILHRWSRRNQWGRYVGSNEVYFSKA